MATDGVKIIDSDIAYDTYWSIMDLYDNGATIETIRSQNPFPQKDDFDYEIYTTAYALEIWEIGHMTDDILEEVKRVIDKGICVKSWTEEGGIKAGKARQKELDKFWSKISTVNKKVRKIKKYKTVTNFLFNVDDVLTFQLTDNQYYATVLFNIKQYRGNCTYEFGKIVFQGSSPPTINDIVNAEIIGRKIPSGHGMDIESIFAIGLEEITNQGGIEEILKKEAEKTGSFVNWMNKTAIDHKDLINFADKFQKIGQVNIKSAYKNTGSYGIASGFDNFAREFPNLEKHIVVFKADKFKIKDLIEG